MAILGIPSTSISDSTLVGRELITAADAAAARLSLELSATDDVTFSSVTATTLNSTTANGARIAWSGNDGILQGFGGANCFRFTHITADFFKPAVPVYTTLSLGTDSQRWADVYSVDGSFSGNLNVETTGTQRVYNLGTESDTNTEYLETSWTANSALIASKATGTGVLREIAIGSDSCKFEARPATNQATIRTDSLPRLVFLGGVTRVWNTTQLSPQTNAATILGNASSRWSNVYSLAGNFSGDVIMAANVDFTGLPTSDPLVAGRLWNHNDTMKISAG